MGGQEEVGRDSQGRSDERAAGRCRVGLGWLALGLLSLLVAGCVNQHTWSPTVDPYASRNPARIEADKAECRRLAMEAAGNTTEETVKGGAVGGLVGAAAGAAIGAAAGSPGTGAAVGAATGGIGAGAVRAVQSNRRFQDAFRRCMEARGHPTL